MMSMGKLVEADETPIVVKVRGASNEVVTVNATMSRHKRQRVIWDEPISLTLESGKMATLKPGWCDLHRYPVVVFAASPHQEVRLEFEQKTLLQMFVASLLLGAAESDGNIFRSYDSAGATLLHAILIANTNTTIRLAVKVMEKAPWTISIPHSEGPYEGVNALHLAIAHEREVQSPSLRVRDARGPTVLPVPPALNRLMRDGGRMLS